MTENIIDKGLAHRNELIKRARYKIYLRKLGERATKYAKKYKREMLADLKCCGITKPLYEMNQVEFMHCMCILEQYRLNLREGKNAKR